MSGLNELELATRFLFSKIKQKKDQKSFRIKDNNQREKLNNLSKDR